MRHTARALPIARPVQDYAVRLTLGTHPDSPHATPDIRTLVRYGASPRAAQALVLGAKIHALTHGASSASEEDVRAIATPALRHRMILNFEGEVARVDTDTLIADLLKATPGAASDRG